MLVMRSLRNTERVLRNPTAEKVVAMEKEGMGLEELAPLISGKKGEELLQTGELEQGLLACGQIVGLIRHIPTVKEVIQSIISEAEQVHRLTAKIIGG